MAKKSTAKKPRLRKAERAMIDAAKRGEEIDLRPFATKGAEKADIRADILRALILQENGWQVHQRGLRIRNARVREQLDLSNCEIPFPLIMRDCEFGEEKRWEAFNANYTWTQKNHTDWFNEWIHIVPVNLELSRVNRLTLSRSLFHGGINMGHAFVVNGSFMRMCVFNGPVWLSSLKTKGQISFRFSHFLFRSRYSLFAQNINIKNGALFSYCVFNGAININGSIIGKRLNFDNSQINSKRRYSLLARGIYVGRGVTIRKSKIFGGVNIRYSHIYGNMSFRDTVVRLEDGNNSKHTIFLQRTYVEAGLYMDGVES